MSNYNFLPLDYDPDQYLKRKTSEGNIDSFSQPPAISPPANTVTQPVATTSSAPKKAFSGFVDWWNKLDPYKRTALNSGMLAGGLKMMEAGGKTYGRPVSALSVVGTGGLTGLDEYNNSLNRERQYGLALGQEERSKDYLDIAKKQDTRAQGLYEAESPYFGDIAKGRARRFIQEERPIYPVTGGYVEVMPDGTKQFRSTTQGKSVSAFDRHKQIVQGFGYMLNELKMDNPRAKALGMQLINPNLSQQQRDGILKEMFATKGNDGKTVIESAEETANRVGGSTLRDFIRYKRALLQSRSDALSEIEQNTGLPLEEEQPETMGLSNNNEPTQKIIPISNMKPSEKILELQTLAKEGDKEAVELLKDLGLEY